MNRKEILDTAIKTVCEERQDSYGKPEDNFAIIAGLWSGYLGDVMLEAEDVAIMMILLKIARIQTGTFKPDNYIDIAGYAACAAEVAGGGSDGACGDCHACTKKSGLDVREDSR